MDKLEEEWMRPKRTLHSTLKSFSIMVKAATRVRPALRLLAVDVELHKHLTVKSQPCAEAQHILDHAAKQLTFIL